MFLLRKLLSSFLYPPGLFVSLLLLLWLRERRSSFLFLALLFYLLSIDPTRDLILYPLEFAHEIPTREEVLTTDVYVVLGGGVRTSRNPFGEEVLEALSLQRTVGALRLYRLIPKRIILSGGSVFGGPEESAVARELLLALGVEDSQIVVETKSRDTFENAAYCWEICKRIGCHRPLVITSAFHMRRAMGAFRCFFENPVPFPVGFFSEWRYDPLSFLPDPQNLYQIGMALREYLALGFYRFRCSRYICSR